MITLAHRAVRLRRARAPGRAPRHGRHRRPGRRRGPRRLPATRVRTAGDHQRAVPGTHDALRPRRHRGIEYATERGTVVGAAAPPAAVVFAGPVAGACPLRHHPAPRRRPAHQLPGPGLASSSPTASGWSRRPAGRGGRGGLAKVYLDPEVALRADRVPTWCLGRGRGQPWRRPGHGGSWTPPARCGHRCLRRGPPSTSTWPMRPGCTSGRYWFRCRLPCSLAQRPGDRPAVRRPARRRIPVHSWHGAARHRLHRPRSLRRGPDGRPARGDLAGGAERPHRRAGPFTGRGGRPPGVGPGPGRGSPPWATRAGGDHRRSPPGHRRRHRPRGDLGLTRRGGAPPRGRSGGSSFSGVDPTGPPSGSSLPDGERPGPTAGGIRLLIGASDLTVPRVRQADPPRSLDGPPRRPVGSRSPAGAAAGTTRAIALAAGRSPAGLRPAGAAATTWCRPVTEAQTEDAVGSPSRWSPWLQPTRWLYRRACPYTDRPARNPRPLPRVASVLMSTPPGPPHGRPSARRPLRRTVGGRHTHVHARRDHEAAARGRCPLRTPDPPLEPEDEAVHLR